MADLTGIIGAMPEELAALLKPLSQSTRSQEGAFTLTRGQLDGHPVLVAQCGIGKVNAAALTTLLILKGAKRLIFTGVAGAVDSGLAVGDLVISRDAVQHDLDVTALGYELGQVPGEALYWPADPYLQTLALEAGQSLPGVKAVLGRIASGDQFVASTERVRWLRESLQATCVEMEGAAMAQVCAKWGVPFVIIRSISDTADHSASLDFREFTPLAAERAVQVVRQILRRL
ncbi:MAG: 5'-methylthioadenosine/adenosylhomocysteine nucleosidase [Truepera sp.]|nr:5'-methylthioadenosine/adenosylhomocysteine nucleosidase [Truepera sp.]